jgi:hypothetical protein
LPLRQNFCGSQLRRAAFGFLALIFALGVLITAEIAAWQGLRFYVAALTATLLLLGLKLVIAAGWSECSGSAMPPDAARAGGPAGSSAGA